MMAYYLPNLSVEQHRCIRLNVQYISSGSCCHFQHSGLSDGTRDQLYLALRLAALELHLEQAMPLPFIADDLFINYDDARAEAGLEALVALSEQTQVIFLSHHDHLVPTVQDIFWKQVNVVIL
jgi:uncharacterized protein YhaN